MDFNFACTGKIEIYWGSTAWRRVSASGVCLPLLQWSRWLLSVPLLRWMPKSLPHTASEYFHETKYLWTKFTIWLFQFQCQRESISQFTDCTPTSLLFDNVTIDEIHFFSFGRWLSHRTVNLIYLYHRGWTWTSKAPSNPRRRTWRWIRAEDALLTVNL